MKFPPEMKSALSALKGGMKILARKPDVKFNLGFNCDLYGITFLSKIEEVDYLQTSPRAKRLRPSLLSTSLTI